MARDVRQYEEQAKVTNGEILTLKAFPKFSKEDTNAKKGDHAWCDHAGELVEIKLTHRTSSGFGCRRDDRVADEHAALRLHDQFPERILHTQEPGVWRGAVVHDVEPVAVAQVARLGPLVLLHLNVAGAGPSFDLDRALGAALPAREQVEPRPVGQRGGAGACRRLDVAHDRDLCFLIRPRDLDGDRLHLLVEALLVLRVNRRDNEGVRDEHDTARLDPLWLVA